MARGWESKDVESQIESAAERRDGPELSPEELELRAKRHSLLLDRKRVLTEMEATRHPRRREMLQQALAHLDRKLAELGGAD